MTFPAPGSLRVASGLARLSALWLGASLALVLVVAAHRDSSARRRSPVSHPATRHANEEKNPSVPENALLFVPLLTFPALQRLLAP